MAKKKYIVYGLITASTVIGKYEADSEDEAIKMAENDKNADWIAPAKLSSVIYIKPKPRKFDNENNRNSGKPIKVSQIGETYGQLDFYTSSFKFTLVPTHKDILFKNFNWPFEYNWQRIKRLVLKKC